MEKLLTSQAIDTIISNQNNYPLPNDMNYDKPSKEKIKKPAHYKLEQYLLENVYSDTNPITVELYDLADILKGDKKIKRIKNWHFRLKEAEKSINKLENKLEEELKKGNITSEYALSLINKANEMITLSTSSKYFKQYYTSEKPKILSENLNSMTNKINANKIIYDQKRKEQELNKLIYNNYIKSQNPPYIKETISDKIINLKKTTKKNLKNAFIKTIDYLSTPKSMRPYFTSFDKSIISLDYHPESELIKKNSHQVKNIRPIFKKNTKMKRIVPKIAAGIILVPGILIGSSLHSKNNSEGLKNKEIKETPKINRYEKEESSIQKSIIWNIIQSLSYEGK